MVWVSYGFAPAMTMVSASRASSIGIGQRRETRIAGRVDLAVVGGTVVYRRGAGADTREEEPPDRPVVLEAPSPAAVVEELHSDRVRPPAVDHRFDDAAAELDRVLPAHAFVPLRPKNHRDVEPRLRLLVRGIEGLGQTCAAN